MIQRAEIDGVPVFWSQGPPPLTASLLFRVGVQDETFTTTGVTHLVEHLAMSTLGRLRHEHNASVDLSTTDFTATGSPDQVARFLADVCIALGALPLGRLATEAKVLAAENGSVAPPAVGELLRWRFGLRGMGLAGVEPPALEQISAETVVGFAGAHFTRANAALALTGPPPEGLSLPLPDGEAPPRRQHPIVDRPLPAWVELGGPAFALSFFLDAAEPRQLEASLTVLRIALDRAMDRLRHDKGWLYEVDFSVKMTEHGLLAGIWADPPTEHAEDVRAGLSSILTELRDAGPTHHELAEDLAAMHEHFADPRTVMDDVFGHAADHLHGEPPREAAERLRIRGEVTPTDCRRVLDRLDGSLLVGMPPDVAPADPRLVLASTSTANRVGGRRFGRHLLRGVIARVPRGAALLVGDAGATLDSPDGSATVLWRDLVGVGVTDSGLWSLYGADGAIVSVMALWFRDGEAAVKEIDRRVPAGLRFVDTVPVD